VPDQVYVRTVGTTSTQSYTFNTTEEELLTIALTLNLQLTESKGSLEVGVQFDSITSEEQSEMIVVNIATTGLWQLYMSKGNMILSPDMVADAQNMTYAPFKTNPQPYLDFIARYGTHYVDSSVVGGQFTQRTVVKYQNDTDKLFLSVGLQGQFNANSGTQVQGSLDFSLSDISFTISTTTISTNEVIGGDADFSDYFAHVGDPQGVKTLFQSWKSTLPRNPVSVRYRLIEIFNLFTDTTINSQLCIAVGTVLGYLPNEDKNYCANSGSSIITGTVNGVTGL